MICRDRLSRLLRYGRKYDGSWGEGEDCDCGVPNCEMLDDGDVDDIIKGLELLRAQSTPPPRTYEQGAEEILHKLKARVAKGHEDGNVIVYYSAAPDICECELCSLIRALPTQPKGEG